MVFTIPRSGRRYSLRNNSYGRCPSYRPRGYQFYRSAHFSEDILSRYPEWGCVPWQADNPPYPPYSNPQPDRFRFSKYGRARCVWRVYCPPSVSYSPVSRLRHWYFSTISSKSDCGILLIFSRAAPRYISGAKRKFPFARFTVRIFPAKS